MPGLNFTPFPAIVTDRLVLRQLEETDDEAIQAIRSNDEVNKYIERAKSITLEYARDFIKRINGNVVSNTGMQWGICLKNASQVIGTICLWNFSGDYLTAEIGYDLLPGFHGQGIMNEAFQPVIDFAFRCGFKSVEAFTHKDNLKSINLLLKNNFLFEPGRKDEKYPDYIIYTLTKEDR